MFLRYNRFHKKLFYSLRLIGDLCFVGLFSCVSFGVRLFLFLEFHFDEECHRFRCL